MISLKAFLPQCPAVSGYPPLPSTSDRGHWSDWEFSRRLLRGGETAAGPWRHQNSVGMMLLAVLATDNLSEMDDRIAAFAYKEAFDPVTRKATRCRFTKEKTLRKALAAALADDKISAILNIELARKAMTVRLIDIDGLLKPSWFGRPSNDGGIELTASFRDLHALSLELEEASK